MRPQFHLTAEHGWVNDPHAITFHEGKYHVFYQYVPDTMVWASNCHWGHAVGDDLISLTRLPVAIAPGDGDDGIWTGSLATDPAGRSTIFYTSVQEPGVGIGRIRTATPTDDSWLSWVKGPVIIEAPTDLDVVAYRDPFVFGDGDGWRMFVGAGLADGRATALAYSSPDLADWRYDGIAAERSTTERTPVWMGALWECPQLFEIDGRHVLVSSVWDDDILYYAGYGIGTYADGRFVAETWGQLTYGPSYYAPSFFRDRDGRPCLTLWMRGVRDADEGWAGAHSIPHLLRLDGDRLVASPHPDLDSYRGKPVDDGVETPGLALDAVWSPKQSDAALGFRSAGRPTLAVSIAAGILTIAAGDERWTMPYDGGDVRVILDGPAAEVSTSAGIFGCEVAPAGVGYETVGDVADAQIRSLTQN